MKALINDNESNIFFLNQQVHYTFVRFWMISQLCHFQKTEPHETATFSRTLVNIGMQCAQLMFFYAGIFWYIIFKWLLLINIVKYLCSFHFFSYVVKYFKIIKSHFRKNLRPVSLPQHSEVCCSMHVQYEFLRRLVPPTLLRHHMFDVITHSIFRAAAA